MRNDQVQLASKVGVTVSSESNFLCLGAEMDPNMQLGLISV